MLLACGVAMGGGGSIDISQLELKNLNASTWVDGTLLNEQDRDSRYAGYIVNPEGHGRILTITAEVVLSPSNRVAIAFGDSFADHFKLENRESVWEILCGRQRRHLTNSIPEVQTGTHTNKIRFVSSKGGAYSPTVTISTDGGKEITANHLAPSKQQWESMGTDGPSCFTHVRVALMGLGSGIKSLEYKWSEPPTLIFIR